MGLLDNLVLRVISGSAEEEAFPVPEGTTAIGRETTNAITLSDASVSRHHARIIRIGNTIQIEDMQSANGTHVNGTSISSCAVEVGDSIRVGKTSFLLELGKAIPVEIVDVVRDSTNIRATIDVLETSDLMDTGSDNIVELRKVHRNLLALYKTTSMVSSVMEPPELLNRVLDLIFDVLPADRGFIMLMDKNAQPIDPMITRERGSTADAPKITVSKSIINEVLKSELGVLSSDAMGDTRFRNEESIIAYNIRSAMCVPIKSKNEVFGIIHVDTKASSNEFSKEDLQLLTAIGNEAGVALENHNLYEEKMKVERLAAIGETVAGLSHYVKNVLIGLDGGAQLVEKGIEENDLELVGKAWAIVQRSKDKISELVLNMLDFSRERKPSYKQTNPNAIVIDLVETMTPLAKERSIVLESKLDDDMQPLDLDQTAIHRAVLNLLTNALDAVKNEKGRVTVLTRYYPGTEHATIEVVDNGHGIPPEELEAIFSPFHSTKGSKGTGLGLAVSQKVVEEHRGSIEVTSKVGQGATFTIRIPAHAQQEGTPTQ